jgi:SHOCT-like protein
MSTAEERLKILNMVAEGKISAEEGSRLLEALQSAERKVGATAGMATSGGESRYLRIRVTNTHTGRERASVNIPVNLVNVAMRMGARFAPEMEDISFEEVMSAINQGMRGKIVDVTEGETGEHVEIFVE